MLSLKVKSLLSELEPKFIWQHLPVIPHINSETNPPCSLHAPTHYHCCLKLSEIVSWHKLRYYSVNMLQHWVGERGLIYFYKMDHSRISKDFSRNWLGLNNLCEIQACSQNFKEVPQNYTEVFNVEDVTSSDVMRRN